MTAYVVFFREGPIKNPDEMQEYYRKGSQAPINPKMKPLAIYGDMTPIEGTPPDGVIVLEFPTVEDAKDWYHGDTYQEYAHHRQKAGDYRGVIVEGWTPPS